MKLILQIALGVFLGTLSSQWVMESWHVHKETTAKEAAEKISREQAKIRQEQGERIRALILQERQGKSSGATSPPPGFVPDDAQGMPR